MGSSSLLGGADYWRVEVGNFYSSVMTMMTHYTTYMRFARRARYWHEFVRYMLHFILRGKEEECGEKKEDDSVLRYPFCNWN